jgi:uncharacterized protein
MARKKLRVILDTNILISFLITNQYRKLDNFILSGQIALLFSDELLEEFVSAALRPKFSRFFTKNDIENLIDFFLESGSLIKINSDVHLCRDDKDNFLLNLALDGKADYLITGDHDLLDLKKIGEVSIISINDFINIIGR